MESEKIFLNSATCTRNPFQPTPQFLNSPYSDLIKTEVQVNKAQVLCKLQLLFPTIDYNTILTIYTDLNENYCNTIDVLLLRNLWDINNARAQSTYPPSARCIPHIRPDMQSFVFGPNSKISRKRSFLRAMTPNVTLGDDNGIKHFLFDTKQFQMDIKDEQDKSPAKKRKTSANNNELNYDKENSPSSLENSFDITHMSSNEADELNDVVVIDEQSVNQTDTCSSNRLSINEQNESNTVNVTHLGKQNRINNIINKLYNSQRLSNDTQNVASHDESNETQTNNSDFHLNCQKRNKGLKIKFLKKENGSYRLLYN